MKTCPLAKIFFALFAAALFLRPAFGSTKIPEEFSTLAASLYEAVESSDGQWIFANCESSADKKNRVYSFDKKTGQARILFEPIADTSLRFVYGMEFFEKTQALYFMVHCGQYRLNGTGNLFLQDGLHTARKDSDGAYSKNGVWRQSAPAAWLLKNLWTAYIKNAPVPDYDGFLRALYSFADPGTNPIFAAEQDGGDFLYERAALEYIVQNKKESAFLSQADGAGYFPLEKYIFRRDKDGNILNESAVTTRKRNPNNAENGSAVWTETTFAKANGSLYFILMKGSFKSQDGAAENWAWDYSRVYEIQDGDEGLVIFRPDALKEIYAALYPYSESDPLPIQGTDKGLLIRGLDARTKWLYDGSDVVAAGAFGGRVFF